MSRLRIINSSQMCKLLESLAFVTTRQKGSHKQYCHADGRVTVVPMHSTDLGRALIRKILRDIEISVDEYNNLF